MNDQPDSGPASVAYQSTDTNYFAKRGLRRYAGFWSLWALGVGAVISGDFFGWNFGLAEGGFGGLAIATVIVATMYVGISYSISEMATMMPYAGGPYAFVRSALGPLWGYFTGLAAGMEYILGTAVIVVGIGGYVGTIINSAFGIGVPVPIWWVAFFTVFVGINIVGVEASFKATMATTFIALGMLCVFWIGAIPNFSWDIALNIEPEGGNSRFLPFGWLGIAQALPFAVWFFLAIEEVPFAAEESKNPQRDMPKAIMWAMLTLIVVAVLTLTLGSGIATGAAGVGESEEPLILAFEAIFGAGIGSALLSFVALAGLVASFHAIIYAYGRNVFSLSRAGYLPKWISVTHADRQTPHRALLLGAAIGLVVAVVIEYLPGLFESDAPVGAILLNMAVFGAVITYVMQMLAFVVIRRRMPEAERPYVSPVGIGGAIVAGVIAVVTIVAMFFNADYRIAILGCVLTLIVGIVYFAVYSRKQLVRSPEEEYALKQTESA